MNMDLSQFKQVFVEEATGLLVGLDNALIELEKEPSAMQYINEAFRAMHTIKGAGGMYGFDAVVEVTHEMEGLYDHVRNDKQSTPQALIELTFTISDHLRELLADEEFQKELNILRQKEILQKISQIRQQMDAEHPIQSQPVIGSSTQVLSTWNILFYPDDSIIKRAINLTYIFHDLFELGEYKISSSPYKENDQLFWSIFLVTDGSYDDIEGVLLFVLDYVKITKIAEFNIFDSSKLQNRDSETESKEVQRTPEINPTTSELQTSDVDQLPDTPETDSAVNSQETFQAPSTPDTVRGFEKTSHSRISVDASKLDELMYLVSELVTTKSGLMLALGLKDFKKAEDAGEKIEKLSNLFSQNALSIRLVSMQEMLSRFNRLIRDLSKHLDKKVSFVTVGEDTELDKSIIDNIGEPLMHLIRNCIDHGIESPGVRLSIGKPEAGIVKLEAVKSGNNVFVTISDDGKGVDTGYVYEKAVEKGFIAPDTHLSDKEILDLIFLPGFSTAQSLTDVSGRGVGMDIVKKKIQDIRGEVSVTSEPGKGTSFILKLQQSVSIVETLLIQSDGLTFAIPVEDIDSCILEPSGNLMNKNSRQLGINGKLIPYISLRESFGSNSERSAGTEKIIIIDRPDKKYAVVADHIIGEFQAVIKPVGEAFESLRFLSGASLLGDGSIALLLDAEKLWDEISVNK
jgi:two-component system chemotaxis sensor kinase CheA